MLKTKEFNGKTPEDAIAKALEELKLERDDISVEIVERGRSGFLGLGAIEATVRISYDGPEDKPAPEEPVSAKTEAAEPDADAEAPAPAEGTPKREPVRAEGAQAEQTEKFLSGLLERMGVQAEMSITAREGGGLNVELSGSGLGAVIGRRGETLDAIQHLTNYAVNRGSGRHAHINVDAENYRAKREQSLERLAEKMADKAVKYRRSMALEPMNSYERHIIHAALQDREDVTTSSTGAEPNRRVVVSYVPTGGQKADADYKEWC